MFLSWDRILIGFCGIVRFTENTAKPLSFLQLFQLCVLFTWEGEQAKSFLRACFSCKKKMVPLANSFCQNSSPNKIARQCKKPPTASVLFNMFVYLHVGVFAF